MTPEQRKLLETWKDKVRRAQMAHYANANRCDRRHLYLGIPVVVLSVIAGATVLSNLSSDLKWIQILIGTISMFVAILAGLQTFLKLADRAEKHRVAAIRFGDLKREIDTLLVTPSDNPATSIESVRERWNKTNEQSPMAVSGLWEPESQ